MASVTQTVQAAALQKRKKGGGGVSPKQCAGSILELNCVDVNPTTSSDHLMDALLLKH